MSLFERSVEGRNFHQMRKMVCWKAGRNLNGLSFSILKSYLTAAFRDQVSIGNSSFWYKLDRALIGSLIKSSYKSFANL